MMEVESLDRLGEISGFTAGFPSAYLYVSAAMTRPYPERA